MASLVLGLALSNSIAASGIGTLGVAAGYAIGSHLGAKLDKRLFSSKYKPTFIGNSQLDELMVQSSGYGQSIPIAYGNNRLAGNIIWATSIEENTSSINHSTRVGKGGGRKISSTEIRYNYTVNLAVALGVGPIDNILKIWADAQLLDPSKITIRFYNGDHQQLPDPLIEAICGINKTPAYRGMAYIVLEQFDLTPFGNRIPNFTFEIQQISKLKNYGPPQLENLLEGVTIIPACGEFVYDSIVQFKQQQLTINHHNFSKGKAKAINAHNHTQQADANLAVKQLKDTCPNLQWTSVTCSWFASNLDISNLTIEPRIEYKEIKTFPDQWQVAGINRATAREITKDQDNYPLFGGTPSDNSIINFVNYLKEHNLKVAFYPLLQIDQLGKPWRGYISGEAQYIERFFTEYNKFILHYAQLLKGKIEAFIIGSELIGLTKIKDQHNKFPAIKELKQLASKVRAILGQEVIITYAADWSEYHHTTDGWFNLDELWADVNIDVIGIDAYFPLTSEAEDSYSPQDILKSWYKGEGYEYYYQDKKRTLKIPLKPEHAWKNLRYFWENSHFNPDSTKTAWQPKMKPIWFTEFGFPSINKASNQPNIFYDPASIDSGVPYNSDGNIDFEAQRQALSATLKFIQHNQDMITNAFAWCWDARPFPYFPELGMVWRDHKLWAKGHWLNGKIGRAGLASVIVDLCAKINIPAHQLDVSKLTQTIEGLIIAEQISVKQVLDSLSKTFFFDIFNIKGLLTFVPRSQNIVAEINIGEMIAKDHYPLTIIRENSVNLPSEITVVYANPQFNYQFSVERAKRNDLSSQHSETIYLPIVTNSSQARKIAEVNLHLTQLSLVRFKFSIPRKFIYLNLGDLLLIKDYQYDYICRITKLDLGANGEIEVSGIQDNPSLYDSNLDYYNNHQVNIPELFTQPIIEYGVIPTSFSQFSIFFAASSQTEGFKPVQIYDENFNLLCQINYEATLGQIANSIVGSHLLLIDRINKIHLVLTSGQLEEKQEYQIALINNEIIHFKKVELIAENEYLISEIIRSDVQIPPIGSRFILLNQEIEYIDYQAFSKITTIKALHLGQSFNEALILKLAPNTLEIPIPTQVQIIEFSEYYQLSWNVINCWPNQIKDYNYQDPSSSQFWIKAWEKDNKLLINNLITGSSFKLCKTQNITKISLTSFNSHYGESKAIILEI